MLGATTPTPASSIKSLLLKEKLHEMQEHSQDTEALCQDDLNSTSDSKLSQAGKASDLIHELTAIVQQSELYLAPEYSHLSEEKDDQCSEEQSGDTDKASPNVLVKATSRRKRRVQTFASSSESDSGHVSSKVSEEYSTSKGSCDELTADIPAMVEQQEPSQHAGGNDISTDSTTVMEQCTHAQEQNQVAIVEQHLPDEETSKLLLTEKTLETGQQLDTCKEASCQHSEVSDLEKIPDSIVKNKESDISSDEGIIMCQSHRLDRVKNKVLNSSSESNSTISMDNACSGDKLITNCISKNMTREDKQNIQELKENVSNSNSKQSMKIKSCIESSSEYNTTRTNRLRKPSNKRGINHVGTSDISLVRLDDQSVKVKSESVTDTDSKSCSSNVKHANKRSRSKSKVVVVKSDKLSTGRRRSSRLQALNNKVSKISVSPTQSAFAHGIPVDLATQVPTSNVDMPTNNTPEVKALVHVGPSTPRSEEKFNDAPEVVKSKSALTHSTPCAKPGAIFNSSNIVEHFTSPDMTPILKNRKSKIVDSRDNRPIKNLSEQSRESFAVLKESKSNSIANSIANTSVLPWENKNVFSRNWSSIITRPSNKISSNSNVFECEGNPIPVKPMNMKELTRSERHVKEAKKYEPQDEANGCEPKAKVTVLYELYANETCASELNPKVTVLPDTESKKSDSSLDEAMICEPNATGANSYEQNMKATKLCDPQVKEINSCELNIRQDRLCEPDAKKTNCAEQILKARLSGQLDKEASSGEFTMKETLLGELNDEQTNVKYTLSEPEVEAIISIKPTNKESKPCEQTDLANVINGVVNKNPPTVALDDDVVIHSLHSKQTNEVSNEPMANVDGKLNKANENSHRSSRKAKRMCLLKLTNRRSNRLATKSALLNAVNGTDNENEHKLMDLPSCEWSTEHSHSTDAARAEKVISPPITIHSLKKAHEFPSPTSTAPKNILSTNASPVSIVRKPIIGGAASETDTGKNTVDSYSGNVPSVTHDSLVSTEEKQNASSTFGSSHSKLKTSKILCKPSSDHCKSKAEESYSQHIDTSSDSIESAVKSSNVKGDDDIKNSRAVIDYNDNTCRSWERTPSKGSLNSGECSNACINELQFDAVQDKSLRACVTNPITVLNRSVEVVRQIDTVMSLASKDIENLNGSDLSSHVESPSVSFISQKRLPSVDRGSSFSFLDKSRSDLSSCLDAFENGDNVVPTPLPSRNSTDQLTQQSVSATSSPTPYPCISPSCKTSGQDVASTSNLENETNDVAPSLAFSLEDSLSAVPETQHGVNNMESLQKKEETANSVIKKCDNSTVIDTVATKDSENCLIVPDSQDVHCSSHRRVTRSHTQLPSLPLDQPNPLLTPTQTSKSKNSPHSVLASPPGKLDTSALLNSSKAVRKRGKPRVSFGQCVVHTDISSMTPHTRRHSIIALFDTPLVHSTMSTPSKSILKSVSSKSKQPSLSEHPKPTEIESHPVTNENPDKISKKPTELKSHLISNQNLDKICHSSTPDLDLLKLNDQSSDVTNATGVELETKHTRESSEDVNKSPAIFFQHPPPEVRDFALFNGNLRRPCYFQTGFKTKLAFVRYILCLYIVAYVLSFN